MRTASMTLGVIAACATTIVAPTVAFGAEDVAKDARLEGRVLLGCDSEPWCKPNVDRARIAGIRASSTLPHRRDLYAAEKLVDGKKGSAWCEGEKGSGGGTTIEVDFAEALRLQALTFGLGYQKDVPTLVKNNRPKTLRVALGDGNPVVLHVASYWDELVANECLSITQCPKNLIQRHVWVLPLGESMRPVAKITIQLDDAYRGEKDDDTCISELGFVEAYQARDPAGAAQALKAFGRISRKVRYAVQTGDLLCRIESVRPDGTFDCVEAGPFGGPGCDEDARPADPAACLPLGPRTLGCEVSSAQFVVDIVDGGLEGWQLEPDVYCMDGGCP